MASHPTPAAYRNVFLALMILLVITVLAAFVPFERIIPGHHAEVWARRASIAIALTIAVMKGLLIIMYFMHVRYGPKLTWAFAGAGFLWLAIMFMLTFADYLTRNHPSELNYKGEPRYLSSQ
jgi:cytochrome c oxidase subunit 4